MLHPVALVALEGGQSWPQPPFLGGQSRLKAGCGQNCPPSSCIGQNRRRLRGRLSKNEGVPSRTPCGECGEPFRRAGYSLSDIKVAREFLEIGGAGCASLFFQRVRERRT